MSNGSIASQRELRLNLTLISIRLVDMLATINSRRRAGGWRNSKHDRSGRWIGFGGGVPLGWCLLLGILVAAGLGPALASSRFAARAEQAFLASRARFQIDTTNAATAWQFGKACFDWAEYAQKDEERGSIAKEGMAACRRSVALDGSAVGGYYYLALNLGQWARTKRLAALKLVPEMERELKKSIELDPKFEHAGPHRSLGLLYSEVPGWPISLGNRSKARLHLEKAVELDGHYPENHLCLLEAFLKWNDRKALVRATPALTNLWPRARQAFAGDDWAEDWADWEKRWAVIRAAAEDEKRRSAH